MSDIEKSLDKAFTDPPKTMEVRDRITKELETAVDRTSVRHIISKLAKICHQKHEKQPYFNYDKDGIFLAAIADKVEN